MLDGLASVVSLCESLSEKLVRLNLFSTIACVFAEVKKKFTLFHSTIKLALRFVNHANLLIAFSLNVAILSLLSYC